MFKMNYLLLSSIIVLLFGGAITAQKAPTTVEEMYGSDNIELQYVSSFEKTTLGGWVQGASMPHPRYYGGSVMYTRNDTSWLYVLGGDTTGGGVATATCLKYNVITDTWEYIAPLPEPLRTNATAILGDKIYTMGGFNAPFPSPAVASFYEYDINTNIWTQLPDLPDPLFFAGAEGFEDSLIYIIGGMQDNVADDDLLRVNVTAYFANSMQFSDATPMDEGMAAFGHLLVDGSLYNTAGLTGTTGNFVPNNITVKGEIDPSDRLQINWGYKADRSLAVYGHYDYFEPGDKIYSAGGGTTPGFDPTLAALGYLINTNTWENEPDLPNPLMAFYGGTNYMSKQETSNAFVFNVVISGGITTGPALTNETWVLTEIIQDISVEEGTVPEEYSLMQNYPNPFNPSTIISFSVPQSSYVILEVFNALGEKVTTLVSENLSAGTYKYDWNASDLPSGIYFYRLQTPNFSKINKMILIK